MSKAILDAAGQAVETECQNLSKELTLTPQIDTKHCITIFMVGNHMDKFCSPHNNTRLFRKEVLPKYTHPPMVAIVQRYSNPLSTPLGAQPNPGMIMTQPGNLKCKNILHLVGQTDPVKINKVVKEALQMCVKKSHTSVAFPAIGTGEIYQQLLIYYLQSCLS